jgi:hypothetical protein
LAVLPTVFRVSRLLAADSVKDPAWVGRNGGLKD